MADQVMIQLEVTQASSSLSSKVYRLWAEAYVLLAPSKSSVVREISVEEEGGVISNGDGMAFGYTLPFAELSLVFRNERDNRTFYAPSHVSSPPFPGAFGAILRVADSGFSSTANVLGVARRIGAHAYIDMVP
jgi:hypothetical protein